MRRKVRELLARTDDDLTDVELFGRAPEAFHFTAFCLDTLGRLPSEVEQTMTCREYTHIKAHSLVRRAIEEQQRAWSQLSNSASG